MSSRLQRSSISPFRSRKTSSAAAVASKTVTAARPTTSSSSGRPATPSSCRPATPSSGRPATPSSGRPATPSSTSSTASARPPAMVKLSPVSTVSLTFDGAETPKSRENVTVTVRFRPLSMREINKGDELAWYADGDCTVRNEYNASIAYGFDKVFGPATTTRHVYDVAAQHVVSGAMEGINGTVFAYGVTSSGKTHTMHGEQKSPGIIPLAIKHVFSIIQETPGREFLLRVSYLEIYNEVINDLLDPIGQNLRIREDSQGTYVEGIKEEVVLSPAHALSLIASGEEHRHVGSNNFNLLSSRSHTIFTLTIESSPSGENGDEDVRLCQLNLIDLAGSESSKTETTGLRRKEGSFINKSLLTLGTVISKLTDGKASHIPYRDSKLTRLLQTSLSGHGRISLICTVTPASSNSEETHNTLKFAHKCKHVEIKASQNKILDEKSLIKKYQREISCLKEELQQLKQGMMETPYLATSNQDDLINLKLQLEAGQVKLQSRLEEEEQAKAALMGRIQRLTKLILVSTKNTIPSNISERTGHRRRHSFGEDELAYLPDRKREYMIDDDDAGSLDSEFSDGRLDANGVDDSAKFDKKNRMRGMLGWFKVKKSDAASGFSVFGDSESSTSVSPSCSQMSQQRHLAMELKDGRRKSVSRKVDESSLIVDAFPERTQAGELFSASTRGRRPPPTGTTIIDQVELLREQVKMLAGEVALHASSLKRLSEQASNNPEDLQVQEQIQKLNSEINEKKAQMHLLEQRMVGSLEITPHSARNTEMFQTLSKLTSELNEKTFELEIMSADNRILQEQLQLKISENSEIRDTVLMLRQQLSSFSDKGHNIEAAVLSEENGECLDVNDPSDKILDEQKHFKEDLKDSDCESSLKSQVLMLAAEIEDLKQEKVRLAEEKDGLEIHSQKLAEEASYAKELAAAAAVELRNLAEEVTKLSFQNAKLTAELAAVKEVASENTNNFSRHDRESKARVGFQADGSLVQELQDELYARCEREVALEAALAEKEQREAEFQEKIDEAKVRERELENELANMWVNIAEMKRSRLAYEELSLERTTGHDYNSRRNGLREEHMYMGLDSDGISTLEEVTSAYENERRRSEKLEAIITRLKGGDLSGLGVADLEELQSFHVEALSKICQEKMEPFVQLCSTTLIN